jgi:hypothetical protein
MTQSDVNGTGGNSTGQATDDIRDGGGADEDGHSPAMVITAPVMAPSSLSRQVRDINLRSIFSIIMFRFFFRYSPVCVRPYVCCGGGDRKLGAMP